MALVAIYVLLALCCFLLYLGFYREDSTIIVLGGFLLVLAGLNIFNVGFQELTKTYYHPLGIVVIFLGLYFSIRGSIEVITNAL